MFVEQIDQYLAELKSALDSLDREAIDRVIAEFLRAWREGRTIFFIGNGGSAATASHFVVDMTKGTSIGGQPMLRTISLGDNVPSLTAWANDVSYEVIFAERLRALASPGDVIVAISCSGNSRNVLEAIRVARIMRLRTIGFIGDQGGQLENMVDICVHAPAEFIGQQEDIHMILDHIIFRILHQQMLTESSRVDGEQVKAMVLAAGEGTRLRPFTQDRAKSMLPIAGKPALEHILNWLRSYGIRQVAINLHHCPKSITSYFGDGERLNMHIVYKHEPQILGTAGGTRNLADFLDRRFVLVYGDVLTDLNLAELIAFHDDHMSRLPEGVPALTMALYRTPNPTEAGIVELDAEGRITRFVEKPAAEDVFSDLANAGVLVIEPGILNFIPQGATFDFGLDLFPMLLQRGIPMFGWPLPKDTYLLDFGSLEKYAQTQVEWPARIGRDE